MDSIKLFSGIGISGLVLVNISRSVTIPTTPLFFSVTINAPKSFSTITSTAFKTVSFDDILFQRSKFLIFPSIEINFAFSRCFNTSDTVKIDSFDIDFNNVFFVWEIFKLLVDIWQFIIFV